MIPYYFLDTNILIYGVSLAADHQSKREIARTWMARGDWGISTQVLMEFSVNACRPGHGLAKDAVGMFIREFVDTRPIQGMDARMVVDALEIQSRYALNMWDAAILAAAKRLGCSQLVSEDLNHGQNYAGVVAVNPFLDTPSPAA
ncbi:MAG: PIN domain-containing protein [Azoarcus sp.]|jgi:predicted nucleic acid-binding protein|nr:PIN domain-containing protein [Azoarcus sp.]